MKATVTNKEYIESHFDYGYYYDGWKMKYRWKFKRFPTEYNVTVKYNDMTKVFDSKDLFDKVEVGDTIDVELTTEIEDNGEIGYQYISNID